MAVRSVKELVEEATRSIEVLSGAEAAKLVGADVVFIDVREAGELERTGRVRGALHVPRGFLEFYADPTSISHHPDLDGSRKLVLYCGSGGRSALAAKTLMDMGITNVAHVEGGFPALRNAGAPILG